MLSFPLPAVRLCLTALLLTGCAHRSIRPATTAGIPQAQVAAPPDPNGWHQVNGDSSQTRYTSTPVLPPLQVAWRKPIPTERGPLVAYGTTVYVADDNKIAAVNSTTGQTLWSIDGHPGFFDYPTSPPSPNAAATRTGLLYSDAASATTVGLAAGDGHTFFQTDTEQSNLSSGDSFGPILLLGDRHFLTAGFNAGFKPEAAPDYSGTRPPDKPQPRLKILDSRTGKLLSEAAAPYPYPYTDQIGIIPGPGPRFFLGAGVQLFTLTGGMHGKITGEFYTDDIHPVVSAQAGRVILVCYPRVYSLNMKLKPQWFRTMPPTLNPATAALGYPPPNNSDKFGSSPFERGLGQLRHFVVVTPRRIIVGDWQHLYGLDAATGRTVWAAPWRGYPSQSEPNKYNILTPPVAADQVLYALSRSGLKGQLDSVTAYSVSTGRVLWTGRVGSDLRSLIVHDGALYIGDEVSQSGKPPAHSHFLIKLTGAGQIASTAK